MKAITRLLSYNLVVGASKYGKSYFMKNLLLLLKTPVMYINWINDKSDWNGYIKIDESTPHNIILDRIKKGKKLVYFTKDAPKDKAEEVLKLYNLIKGNMKLTLVLDEVHLMNMQKELKNWLIELATTGRHKFKSIVYLTQRMSKIPNEIFTQSEKIFFFHQKMENQYYKREGFDYQKEVGSKIGGRKYHYVVWDGFKTSNVVKS